MQLSFRCCWAIAHALIVSPYVVHLTNWLSRLSSVRSSIIQLDFRIWALPIFPLQDTASSLINQRQHSLRWMGTFQQDWIEADIIEITKHTSITVWFALSFLLAWCSNIEQDIMLPITIGTDPHIIINSINATKAIIDDILHETLLPIICRPIVDVFRWSLQVWLRMIMVVWLNLLLVWIQVWN